MNTGYDESSSGWNELNRIAEELANTQPRCDVPSYIYKTLSLRDFENVYEPAEDTFLLLDAIKYDLSKDMLSGVFDKREDAVICLEVGCGTGVASSIFQTCYNELVLSSSTPKQYPPLIQIAIDLNPKALEITKSALESDQLCPVAIEVIQGDLMTNLSPSLHQRIDYVIFNPPYVPTPNEELMMGDLITKSWAGGRDGRVVIDRFLPGLSTFAAGTCWMITVDDNKPLELSNICERSLGLSMTPLMRRRARNEFLTVQRITRKSER